MMRLEPREDGPNINIVTRSGIAIKEDKDVRKQLEENPWLWRATKKDIEFYLRKEKETFMEVKKSFVDSGASKSKSQSAQTEKPKEVIAM